MGLKLVLTGNYALAYAAKVARVNVVAAYPITPQTSVVEKLAEFIEEGELDAVMIRVESEHSALAACFGAALAGARVFTATSSQGLLYMHEVVHWASRARAPMVMGIVTRTIGPPWNIWPDHTDYMDQRDTGWVMSFAMDNQEALDLTLQAFKVSEDPRVYLPVMVGIEGFILGHTSMPVEVPEQKLVDEWLGPRRQPYVVDGGEHLAIGNLASPEDTEEFFMDVQNAMEQARKVVVEVEEEYSKISGRPFKGPVECFKCEDAKYVAISMGAWSGDLMESILQLRDEGYSVGLMRIRYYRPFPGDYIFEKANSAKGVVVFDRSVSFGSYGPIFLDTAASFLRHARKTPYIKNVVAGIGGVNITSDDFSRILRRFVHEVESDDVIVFEWYHKGKVVK
ncbi:pyruvate ferredoxin oxidoreductase [Thermogladius sp. KZ2Tp1]|uniref:pyruvate ferredoxin oxidoreductase n=1 Tax=Thermogladius sp. KZ2Tp1 TaxID=3136289 RepID=UPI003DA80536